jgi:hypothetical protein
MRLVRIEGIRVAESRRYLEDMVNASADPGGFVVLGKSAQAADPGGFVVLGKSAQPTRSGKFWAPQKP